MDENGRYLTAGELAMWEQRGGYGYDCHKGSGRGMAATGIGLAAGLGGAALLGTLIAAWGANQASKARARAAENKADGNTKTLEILSGVVNREATRQDGINIDVTQTLRSLTSSTAQGGSASSSALATAEALALLNSASGSGRNGQTCPTPVALYQPAMPCRCNTCGD